VEHFSAVREQKRAEREEKAEVRRRLEEAEAEARDEAEARLREARAARRSGADSGYDGDVSCDGSAEYSGGGGYGGNAVSGYRASSRRGLGSFFGGLLSKNQENIIDAVKNDEKHILGSTGLPDNGGSVEDFPDATERGGLRGTGLLRYARNDGVGDTELRSRGGAAAEDPRFGIEPLSREDPGRGLGDYDVGVAGYGAQDGEDSSYGEGLKPGARGGSGASESGGVGKGSRRASSSGASSAASARGKGPKKGADTGDSPAWISEKTAPKAERSLGLGTGGEGFKTDKAPVAYNLPPIELLKKSTRTAKGESERELLVRSRRLEDILRDFRVDAKVLNVTVGPTVTRYEVEPDVGVKISSIKSLEPDLALRLEVKSVRVVPMPGQAVVGIEAYNAKRNLVTLREMIDSSAFSDKESKVAFVLGKNISGEHIIADLADMPHLLIAGTTGSGKSVCINSILLSIMYRATPDEVKLILVDPKVVELKPYSDIPHLLLPVVTSPERAATALGYAVTIMNERYAKFAEYNVRNLEGYNELMLRDGMADEVLPQIVIVIDELSDLMMIAPQKVQESISRLAAMARAAGMHLIVATQQPLASILTSVIKANIPSRIAFSVSSNSASRVILDEPGAERLHGKGDMLFSPVGTREPMRIQGSFVSEAEVYKVTEFVKKEADPDYSPDILDAVSGGVTGELTDDEDDLFRDAVEAVVAAKQASVSMLQRRFRVGYNRAARLVDMMEERGMVAPSDGTNKPRKVLMTEGQFADFMTGAAGAGAGGGASGSAFGGGDVSDASSASGGSLPASIPEKGDGGADAESFEDADEAADIDGDDPPFDVGDDD
jgi:hypothetical protein